MKLSIITLTYNKLDYTKKFIESLYKYTNDFELIVVDNGSCDGTVEFLKTLNIKLILNQENQGFSIGNNQGLKLAEGEYIAFLNNDILLSPNWFEECKKVFEAEQAGFVSPRQIDPHFNMTDEKVYLKYFADNCNYKCDYEKSFDECVFSCVLTRRDVLDKIGNFDECYTPAFFEDNDFKYRAIMAGYDIFVVNTVCFYHFGSVTSVNHKENFERNRQYYYSKFPLAEYLAVSGAEKHKLKLMTADFQRFPLNLFYELYILCKKFKNRLKKGIIKH